MAESGNLTLNEQTGLWGEQVAADWLFGNGYAILGRRVRPNRHDEIDIVARKGDVLAFIEVKTRAGEYFGRPAAAVNAAKKKALCRAAAAYLRGARYPNLYYRFDIVEVIGRAGDPNPVVRHLEDAFRFPPRYRFMRQQPAHDSLLARLFGA
jgi:putative endonuclease